MFIKKLHSQNQEAALEGQGTEAPYPHCRVLLHSSRVFEKINEEHGEQYPSYRLKRTLLDRIRQ